MPHQITRKAVYVDDRELTPLETNSADVKYVHGPRPGPDLADPEIESRAHRRFIPPGQGEMCITIEPSEDVLGAFYVNVQFEARPGEHDACQGGQNRILVEGTELLKQLLDEISAEGVEWDIAFDAKPCPKATVPVALENAAAVVTESKVGVVTRVGPTTEVTR